MFVNIHGYPNYQISSNGDVKNIQSNKVLKTKISNSGYHKIGLCKHGKQIEYYVHRLLAKVFIPNIWMKPCVDHIDRNKLNNSLENLRWATISENALNRDFKKEKLYHTNKYNERYISFDKTRKLYVVRINNSKQKIAKRCKTLEDAIEFRDSVL